MRTARRLVQLSAKPKRVEVEWIDSGAEHGWKDAAHLLDDLEAGLEGLACWTAGYLVDERDESITVALSFTVDPKTGLHSEYGAPLTIPRVAVVAVRELRR